MEMVIEWIEANRGQTETLQDAVTNIYDRKLDVVVIRNAFPVDLLSRLATTLDVPSAAETWSRPNSIMPTEDIFILGTDIPATPTCKAPRGASLEKYLESASQHQSSAAALFDASFDVEQEIAVILSALSKGRKAAVPVSADGRRYVPYTLRLLREGKQISVHHDYHYPLDLYSDLSVQLDSRTLISFFLTLQRPEAGGGLIVYGLDHDDPRQPKFPNGWWDVGAMESQFEHVRFDLWPGDFILLASGRRFHRVEPVVGRRSRVTLGGFLALDKAHERVLFWS